MIGARDDAIFAPGGPRGNTEADPIPEPAEPASRRESRDGPHSTERPVVAPERIPGEMVPRLGRARGTVATVLGRVDDLDVPPGADAQRGSSRLRAHDGHPADEEIGSRRCAEPEEAAAVGVPPTPVIGEGGILRRLGAREQLSSNLVPDMVPCAGEDVTVEARVAEYPAFTRAQTECRANESGPRELSGFNVSKPCR
jgi:hypothetical protein